jgi:hypothetical protein
MHTVEPALYRAAILLAHWQKADVEAVVLLLAEIITIDDLGDLVVGLLQLHGQPPEAVAKIIADGAARAAW